MECRYLGQGFELRAKMPDEPLNKQNVKVVIDNFYDVHKQQYGHAFQDQITEAITIRIVASVDVDKLSFTRLEVGGVENPSYAQLYLRDTIFDDGKSVSTPRYSRDKLKSGDYLTFCVQRDESSACYGIWLFTAKSLMNWPFLCSIR